MWFVGRLSELQAKAELQSEIYFNVPNAIGDVSWLFHPEKGVNEPPPPQPRLVTLLHFKHYQGSSKDCGPTRLIT